jgi:hypothetical protein
MSDLICIIVIVIASIIITIGILLKLFGRKFDLIKFLSIAPCAMYLLPIVIILLIKLVLFVKSLFSFL